jgi:hypothetical protein
MGRAPARGRRSAGHLVATCLAAVGLVALPGAAAVQARAGPLDLLTVNLWPAGKGTIVGTPQGGSPVTCAWSRSENANPCPVTVSSGLTVDLTATADQTEGSQFKHWSRSDCGAATTCTITPEHDGEWAAAVFSPLGLEVGINGNGTVTAAGLTTDCPNDDPVDPWLDTEHVCKGTFDAEANITLTAHPGATTDTPHWHPGYCDPDPSGLQCTVTMTNVRTFASVAFGTATIPEPPFKITPEITVKRSGHGKVSGSGRDADNNPWSIDCGTKCSDLVGYQSPMTLSATPDPGWHFVRWVSVCGTATSCRFRAGSATTVGARFEATPPPPPPPPPPSPPPRVHLKAKLVKLSVKGTGRGRVIVFVVLVNKAARMNTRLLKRSKSLASRRYALANGRNARRLRVPKSAKPGLYRLSLKISASGETKVLTKRLKLRR